MDANDRERERMGKLNTAFNSLRHLLPKHGNDRELSKFETVQIAKNYIRALNQMLAEDDHHQQQTHLAGQQNKDHSSSSSGGQDLLEVQRSYHYL